MAVAVDAGPRVLPWSALDAAGYGGRSLLGAQGIVAAGHTVDTDWRWVHALHVTHLAAGDADRPVDHHVECLYDTGRRSVRAVRAMQDGVALAAMTVSFQGPVPGRGAVHREAGPGDWPDPHALPAAPSGAALDVRRVDRGPAATERLWLRFTDEIPDRILLHAAALACAAEHLLVTADGTEGLDLSLRIHRAFRADDWLRHERSTPAAADHRALTTGRFFSSMGRLVATVSQDTASPSTEAPFTD